MLQNTFTAQRSRAFTLVELIIVIAVIGILATVGIYSYAAVQKQTRDSQRASSTSVISEELEKYYEENGEYPGCGALTQSADAVTTTTLNGMDKNVLKAPTSSPANGNSIVCADITSSSDSGVFGYVGDGSDTCQTGDSCLEWTLKYREESTGEIKVIHSRHATQVATSGSTTVTATTAGDNQVNVSWTTVPNAVNYQLQQATDAGFTTNLTNQTIAGTSSIQAGLSSGKTYYYRVMPNATSSQGNWSNVASATTTVSPPSGTPIVAAALISSNTYARGTASGAGTCASDLTLEYSIQYNSTGTSTDGSWSGYTLGATRDQAAWQGNKYTYQARARCVGSSIGSSYKVSATAYVVRPFDANPPAPGWQITTEWLAGYNYQFPYSWTCPAGTNIGPEGVVANGKSTPWYDWWYVGWNAGQYDSYHTYTANYRCYTAYAQVTSATTSTTVHVYCEPGRRSFSASPRCDSYGQGQGGNAYAN